MAQTRGDSPNDDGVVGTTLSADKSGVFGFSAQGAGVSGITQNSAKVGVFGTNDSPNPPGDGAAGAGVFGHTRSPGAAGVFGANNTSKGVGVQGNGPDVGVSGFSDEGIGVRGDSKRGAGVVGFTHRLDENGIFGINDAVGLLPNVNRIAGAGVWGHTKVEKGGGIVGTVEPGLKEAVGVTGIGPTAGRFIGDVVVDNNLKVAGDVELTGKDCAEDFEVSASETNEPGTVMVIDTDGSLRRSTVAYDKRVAGVISGAGAYKPAILLGRGHLEQGQQPIGLVGRVYCKVDARYGAIEVGDLLTTSHTPGYAMKATDSQKAFGAVIGKALRSVSDGCELVPILIALQ